MTLFVVVLITETVSAYELVTYAVLGHFEIGAMSAQAQFAPINDREARAIATIVFGRLWVPDCGREVVKRILIVFLFIADSMVLFFWTGNVCRNCCVVKTLN